MVDTTTETIQVPLELLQELTQRLAKVEEVLATLEELSDSQGAQRIRQSEKDLQKGRYKTAKTPEELDKILR